MAFPHELHDDAMQSPTEDDGTYLCFKGCQNQIHEVDNGLLKTIDSSSSQ